MSDDKPDPRPHDPYRRARATIDLEKDAFSSTESPVSSAPHSVAPEPAEAETETATEIETAIEPMAATALDGRTAAPDTSAPQPDAGPDHTGDAPGAIVDPALASSGDDPDLGPRGASPPTVSPAGTRSRGRAGGLIAASLFGGVIGAGMAIGADTYWRQPPADFESRLSALETRPRPSASALAPADASGLDRRIAALESGAKGLADGVAAAKAAADAATRQATDIAARPAPAGQPGAPEPGVLSGLEGRVATLEATVKAAPPADALGELGARLQALRSEADAQDKARAAALASVQAATSSLGGRLDGIDHKVSALAEEVGKLPPGLMQAGLRLVVAGQASEALRGGGPLAPALAALDKLGIGGAELAALRPYADQPAPDASVLAAEFRPLAERISAQSQEPAGSIGERLLRMADKIVTVRAVGDGSGRDVPGLLRRTQLALDRGALPEAAATFDQLPEGVRAPASTWAARLKQRVAADAAARRIGAASLSALDAPAR